jgi:DNA-binding transcriptional LysR family regulator
MSDGRLSAIDAFLAVTDAGSFGGAARHLGLTQSTISRRVAQLEDQLGTRLLARTTRNVSLTPAGEAFADRARRALAILNEAEAELGAGDRVVAGLVRITAPTAFGRAVLAPVIAAVTNENPNLRIDLDLSDRYLDLQTANMDLAIRFLDEAPSGWVVEKLGSVPGVLCASPAYLEKHGIPRSPDDLRKHRLVAAKTYTARTKWTFLWNERRMQVDVDPVLVVSDFTALATLVREGCGITALPSYLAFEGLAAGNLVAVLQDSLTASAAIYVARPAHLRQARRLDAIVDLLRVELDRLRGRI